MAEQLKSKKIKSLKELTVYGIDERRVDLAIRDLLDPKNSDSTKLKEILSILSKIKDKNVDILAINDQITRKINEQGEKVKSILGKDLPGITTGLKLVENTTEQLIKRQERYNSRVAALNSILKDIQSAFQTIIRQNKELYEISHNMQTESNVTWRQFTKMYDEAYRAARQMNSEIGKQLFTAKDLISAQDKLLGSGWKGLDPSTLTNVSSAVNMLQRTLGGLDDRLVMAFQTSFRQFGSQTDNFITQMGNRLNAFSNTFGIQVSALQGAVAEVISTNAFIARNNLNAQLQANQTFMQAAALSSLVGVTSLSYLSGLVNKAQFGTADELVSIYQSGAYLQDFDTNKFIDDMAFGNTYEGTKALIESIYNTLSSIGDNRLLRNQFIQGIQQGFGLSTEDITAIMTHGANLDTYDKEIQDKLLKVNNSMVDELTDLKQTLIEQIENFWSNSPISQGFGKVMNELGLYDINKLLSSIKTILIVAMGTDIISSERNAGINNLANFLTGGGVGSVASASKPVLGVTSPLGKLGLAGTGIAIATTTNAIGSSMISGNTRDSSLVDTVGWGTNILGGAGGGALTGMALGSFIGMPIVGATIGAVIGGLSGLYTSLQAREEKLNAMAELDAADRAKRRAAQSSVTPTGDPVIDTLNQGFSAVVNAITGEGQLTRQLQFTIDLAKKGSTKVNGSVMTGD